MKVYADTSVYGGVFNYGFEDDSAEFFAGVRDGRYALVTSTALRWEINRGPSGRGAPGWVRELYAEVTEQAELVESTDASRALRNAYLTRGVVTAKSIVDATHVALATLAGCDAIVAWDAKHIVNWHKIPLYNEVNAENGYNAIRFFTPTDLTMTIQAPKPESEWNPEWIRPWPEWRDAIVEFRAMVAAMTPEEEKAFWAREDAITRREMAEAKRRAAAGKRTEAVAGRAPAYPMHSAGNRD